MATDRDNSAELKAAEEAVDPDRLLDGEDPQTRHPDDAAHWIVVYSELLRFKERLVATADQGILEMTETSAQREAAGQDVVILAAERDRLVRRLAFWKQRQRELAESGRA